MAEVDAVGYRAHAPRLRQVALDSLARLRDAYDVVICEGAGSPAEINLRETDIANMGLARAADLPVIVVGDIDRGGVFAALYGTLALLAPDDQALISGFVVNKFRGAPELLDPGLAMLRRAHRPPRLRRAALAGRPLARRRGLPAPSHCQRRYAIRRRARPYGQDRSCGSRWSGCRGSPTSPTWTRWPPSPACWCASPTSPAELADADLVVLPGSRATVADLAWLRDRGLAAAVTERARAGRPVLGICGGYQMLAGPDRRRGRVAAAARSTGSGCCRCGSGSARRRRSAARGAPRWASRCAGTRSTTASPRYRPGGRPNPSSTAAAAGRCGAPPGTARWRTTSSGGRFLAEVAALAGRDFTPAPGTSFAAVREERLDVLADLVTAHLDTAALSRLIEDGPVPGLPALVTSLSHDR